MRWVLVPVIGFALGGCVGPQTTASLDQRVAASPPQAVGVIPLQTAWTMPWQLSPTTPQSRRERIVAARVPALGIVRGTRSAIRYVAAPLPVRAAGRNRLVAPCRDLISTEARKFGAVRVDAASQGPDRRRRDGATEGPVGFRIIYADGQGYQVRQTVLNCRADARGRIVATDVIA